MSTYVAILDVGHGNSTILNDNGKVFIIDCGTRGPALLEFLNEEGINEIESVFISHADQDHIGGLVTLLSSSKFTIKSVYLNSDSSKESDLWDDLTYELSHLQQKGILDFRVGITVADGGFACGDILLRVVGPTGYLASKGAGSKDRLGTAITSNSISASFHVVWKDASIAYLAGDIDEVGLADLKDHNAVLASPLLVYPHHGGDCGGNVINFTEELCDLTAAETVIFSIGRNKHANPKIDVVAAVRRKIAHVRIACTQLSKNCAANDHNILPVHLSPMYAKGRVKNHCCGGTFVIHLDDTITYSPDANSHRAFIQATTTTPICIN